MTRIATFDLGAFGEALEREPSRARLRGMIRRLISLHSLYTDLDSAADTFRVLLELSATPVKDGDWNRLRLESALLENGIVLYARSTKSTSRERAGFDIRHRLSESERAVHAEICDLRDQAVAHFGSGGSYKGQWKAETAVFQMEGNGFRLGVVARRVAFDLHLIERIKHQIDRARMILAEAYEAHLDLLTSEFAHLLTTDMHFVRRLHKHQLDLSAWLGSRKLAADVLTRRQHKGTTFR